MVMIFFFMFICGALSFTLNWKNLLLMLLSLEFVVVSLYFNIFYYLMKLDYEFFFSMIFLIVSVCEGVLGLSLLVLMVRVFGNDYILSFSSLW